MIALDGPAGSGKSTIAAQVARQLGFIPLNSGLLYRALAKWMEQRPFELETDQSTLF